MRPVPERLAAIAAGERFYTDGKPCKNGHFPARRRTATGQCCKCSDVRVRRWLDAHPGEEARWARERRAKDPTGHRAEVRRWQEKNPQQLRAYARAYASMRRTRKRQNGGSFSPQDVEAIRKRQRYRCAECRKKDPNLQVDHINPVIRGGSSDPSNLQLLCDDCNKRKGAKDFIEWARANSRLL